MVWPTIGSRTAKEQKITGTNHISGTAEARVVKFCLQVGYVKFQHKDNKSP